MAAPFKAVRIKSRDEFDSLIEHLTHEAYRARDNWDFWGALETAVDYSNELSETPALWGLIERTNKDMAVLRLGRLYDPHGGVTSLGNLLQTIKENSSRAGTIFPPSMTGLDLTELDSEIAAVSETDPIVAKLVRIRNEYLAHRGNQHVAKGTFASLPTLDLNEISTLLARALDLLRKYRERLGYARLLSEYYVKEELYRLLSLVRTGRSSTDE